ncbi:MAG: tetratricopeptide repeat protein [Candidatus Aminicenantes bacterium]|nr:MAG: tetratricopeptide repeat protein [Candidatus Aminicenantes bacterium]
MRTINNFILIGLSIVSTFYMAAFAATTGAVEGFVKDEQTGKPILKAKITFVSTKSSSIRLVSHSDKKGHFYRGGFTVGVYQIIVEKENYMPMQSTVRVSLGDTAKIEIKLRPFKGPPPLTKKISSKAISLLNEGKYEESIEKFTESIADDPENPIFYYYRGAAFEKTGDLDKAMEDYQKSVELKPDFILPTANIGKIYAKKKQFEMAIEFYKKAVELGDQDATNYYNYGICFMNLGKNEQAKEVLEKLISLDENYSDAYYQLGIIYIGLGNSALAKEFLQKFIELDPENKNASIAKEILKSLNLP